MLRIGAGFPCDFRPRGRRGHHLWPLAGIAGSGVHLARRREHAQPVGAPSAPTVQSAHVPPHGSECAHPAVGRQCFASGGLSRVASDHADAVATTCGHWREPPGRNVTSHGSMSVHHRWERRWRPRYGVRVLARGDNTSDCADAVVITAARARISYGSALAPTVQGARVPPRRGDTMPRGRLPRGLQVARTRWPSPVAIGENRWAATSRRQGGVSKHHCWERRRRPRCRVRVPLQGGDTTPAAGYLHGVRPRGRRSHHLWPLARTAGP